MKRTVAAVTLVSLAWQAHAVGRLADIQIRDRDTGALLDAHYFRGDYWVAGTPGDRYAIVIRNRQSERVLAVTAVDGLNVISGEDAGWQQTGYVFGGQDGYEIAGWRKSQAEIADFVFTSVPDSYAARTGRGANVGVIGVALFIEQLPVPAREAPSWDAADGVARAAVPQSAPANPLAQRATGPQLGTGHGERESSSVVDTEFTRASERPTELIRIRYDSYAHLVALGVIRHESDLGRPEAFPASSTHFVPDPPG